VSWRWVVDVRGPEPRVDRKWLAIAVLIGLVIAGLLLAILPSPADYIAVGVIAAVGIAADVLLRRAADPN